jgi:hypothetical protein
MDGDMESSGELRPQMPRRPQRMASLSEMTIGSMKSLRISELQARPTTEITTENALILSGLEAPKSPSFNPDMDNTNSDAFTIRTTTPTLTIYSDDDEGNSFADRLEQIISQSNPEIRLDFSNELEEDLQDQKQFFILSSAGKPIYSNVLDEEQKFVGYGGIIQTFVSSFLLNGSHLKSIVAGSTTFTILDQSPIILMAVTKLHEQEADLLNQLDLLYSFLLSTFSKPHIVRSFQNKEGFDLGKHLGRSCVSGLDFLCKEISDFNPGILVGALRSMRLGKSVRDKISQVLLRNRSKEILYGLLVAPNGRLVNIMRPKSHTLHTTDLQILFLTVANQSKDQAEDEELWIPICLPKFNPNGFLHVFVKFVGQTALILISADKNSFFEVRATAKKIIKDMDKYKLFQKIAESIHRGISTVDIPAPLVYHFIYKSKRHLQYVTPTSSNFKHLHKYYLRLYSSVDRNNRISVSYLKWDQPGNGHNSSMAGIGWVTPNYEVYLITGSITKKEVLVNSAKAIVNWCRKYEDRLFVCEGATY